MAEELTEHAHPVPVPGWLAALCRVFAGIGGLTLLAMMLMTVASVTLRSVVGRPISGDFELVEMGSAIAIFCFLPWCQLRGGHITVDLLSERFGPRRDRMLSLAGSLMMAAAALVIAWRLWFGMADKLKYNETTFILGLPMWWFFAISVPPAAIFVLASLASAWRHWRLLRARRARA